MSNFTFRPAVREGHTGLFVGLTSGSGGGKTNSALLLATGIAGRDRPFAVIDTEGGRALHYAPKPGEQPDFINTFRFDHGDLQAPFTPENYAAAIQASIDAGYPCIVVDSMSHEHEGEGGLLDMAEAELDRMAGTNWEKRAACTQAAWIRPKGAHKKMMRTVLQPRVPVILCFRAEQKTELKKIDGKMVMVPKVTLSGLDGWVPICEKKLPFELTASFLLTPDAPGMPKPIKLNGQHRALFPLDQPISEESGRRIAAWASGGVVALPEWAQEHLKVLGAAQTLPDLQKAFTAAQAAAREHKDAAAMAEFVAAKDKQKAKIEGVTA